MLPEQPCFSICSGKQSSFRDSVSVLSNLDMLLHIQASVPLDSRSRQQQCDVGHRPLANIVTDLPSVEANRMVKKGFLGRVLTRAGAAGSTSNTTAFSVIMRVE